MIVMFTACAVPRKRACKRRQDLYAVALKTNRRSGVALAGSLLSGGHGAGLEPAEDLSRAIVNRRIDPIRRLAEGRADMPVCLRRSLL
jgi:hypothetical protein